MAAAGQPKAVGLSFRRRARLPVEASLMKFIIVQNDMFEILVLCGDQAEKFAVARSKSALRGRSGSCLRARTCMGRLPVAAVSLVEDCVSVFSGREKFLKVFEKAEAQ